jgi:hypothetical protein
MTAPVASFTVVVPPGWARLPAREDDRRELTAAVRAVIARALPDDLPRDRAEPLRQEMRKRLVATVAEAGDNGATAVYLPVQPVDGFTPPVSVIESEVEDESEESPADVIAQLLADAVTDRHDTERSDADEDATGEEHELPPGVREVDGGIAARTETVVRRADPAAALPGIGDDLPVVDDRQVTYTIPVPHRPGRWVVMSFSAISAPDADPRLTEALVGLFDAVMTTFRWTDVPGAEPTTLERRLAELHGTA